MKIEFGIDNTYAFIITALVLVLVVEIFILVNMSITEHDLPADVTKSYNSIHNDEAYCDYGWQVYHEIRAGCHDRILGGGNATR